MERLFDKGQDITLGMAFRLCNALEVKLSDLVEGLELKEGRTAKKDEK